MNELNEVIQQYLTLVKTKQAIDNKAIVVPPQQILNSEIFQVRLRELKLSDYEIAKRVFEQGTGKRYSSRKHQDTICHVLYTNTGSIYCSKIEKTSELNAFQSSMRKLLLPDVNQALGDDARWMRLFLTKHNKRRDSFKLALLSVDYLAVHGNVYETYQTLMGVGQG